MSEILICPICKTGLKKQSSMSAGSAARIDCPNCGYYILDYIFYADYIETKRLNVSQLATLSYAIRRMQNRGPNPPHVVTKLALDVLQNTTLPAAAEQLDNLVIFIGQELTEPGQRHNFDIQAMKAQLGSITTGASEWVIEQAMALGLVQGEIRGFGGADEVELRAGTLSIHGWQRYAELQSVVSGSKRAFMAMKFDDKEMDYVFTNCFKSAAERAGYKLVKLDDEPRAGLIDDRLRLEIRTSRFLIADLSHANKGAYWEAGYAEGLGRPVIYTCKESTFKHEDSNMRPHFDTNHHLIVPWDVNNLQLAADKITATIRVTLPSEAILEDK